MNKVQKQLSLTCPTCQAIYQLVEIHQQKSQGCEICLLQWKQLLHSHYQEQIILHLAQAEAAKDQKDQNHD